MRDVLIDLGEVPHGESLVPAVPEQAPPVPYRALLAALSVALLLGLGGAAHLRAPAPPAVVAAGQGDLIRVVGDRLYVIGRYVPPGVRVIRSFSLPDATQLSWHRAAVTGEVLDVAAAGDVLLMSVQDERTVGFGTIALRAGVPVPLWRRTALLEGVSADERLVLVREPGADGTWWRGLDLATGAVRWSVRQAAGDEAAPSAPGTGYPRWLYQLTRDRRLQAWDTRTGRLAAGTDVPQRGPENISLWPAGDLALIGARGAGTTGYDATENLRQRWHSGVNLSWYRNPAPCGELICTFLPQRGIMVIDPRTGRERWSSDRWSYAERIGSYLVTGRPGTAFPEHFVLDPATGDVLGEAGRWQSGGPGPAPETAYVRRAVARTDRVWFGVLDMRTMRIRVSGAAEQVAGDCHFAAGALICRRLDASVGVWRLD
ncbi:PQQ-like beta-propeller repeat protein [Actinoplanes sp. DH11]|uniref:PQQ-like beta-propeller repeat protein n=1 Tax=Actinoplanes sp. DH11 TaxID=2857011 RepID=UPI001E2BB7FF|nr:PQQ-like beta-propeller repeat protein [Actinoplanes sp. DH11]